jgi:hypothetical protein
MKAHANILVILLVVACDTSAQQSSFWPHHVGDMWEYFVLDGVGNDTLQVRVIFDSTDPGGISHVRHHRQLVNPVRPPWFPWYNEFRVDTSGSVFGTGFLPPNSVVYRFDVQVGQWWFVHYQGGPGGDVAKLVDEYLATVFGQPTTVKEIWYFFTSDTSDTTIWLWQYSELLAEGFGTIFRGDGDLGYNLYLMGCKIDGVLYGDTTVVSVDEPGGRLPSTFVLHQNYPNPFNPNTTIRYSVATHGRASLRVYDLLGCEVAVLVDDMRYPGEYSVTWKPGDLPSGVYFYRLTTAAGSTARRMLLVK